MPSNGFTYLDVRDLRAFELLETPIYVYSFSTQRIAWANQAALRFWNAESQTELLERDLTPFSTSTTLRLKDYLAAFRRGERRTESWTYYPKGVAVSALAHCRGVSMEGHDEAILVENKALDQNVMPVSELRAIEALRHTPVLVSMVADDGTLLLRNPAATDFYHRNEGSDPAQSDGIGSLRRIFEDPEDFTMLLDKVREVGHASLTARMVDPASTFHSVQLTRIIDPATGEPSTLWVQQDVTQLREMTLQLATSEAALDIVLGVSGVPSLLVSATDGRLLKANFAARKSLEVEPDQPAGTSAIFAEDGVGQVFFDAVLADGSSSMTALLFGLSGRTFWANVLGTWLSYEGEDAVLLIISDVDELHKAATELEVALNVERGVSEMQRRMLEIASHEFRTPLAVIDGAAQRIARRSRQMTPEQLEELAGRIRSFVSALNSLLDKTIERARKNLAGVHCERALGQLQQPIAEVCASFADKADIAIDPEVSSLPPLWFDRVLFYQALVNLIENAIKYSKGRGRLHIFSASGPGRIELFVRDWGIGIPPADRERIFAERTRGSNVDDHQGNGLGLFIVRSILRAHGGDVSIVDTEGPGTTVRLVLPRGLSSDNICKE